jgi:hypothetical protein
MIIEQTCLLPPYSKGNAKRLKYCKVIDGSGRGMMARYAEKFQNRDTVGTNSPWDSASMPQNATLLDSL